MSDLFDVIVIGSGPAGVHASVPLVDAGLRVAMVDGGNEPSPALEQTPALPYEKIRETCNDQYRWFLGDDFSGIPLDEMSLGRRGSIVSGQRRFVTDKTDEYFPVQLLGAQVIQTLAKGGLAAAWGGVCAYFSPSELEALGIPAEEMERHYDLVTTRIGVSGPLTRTGIQSPGHLDHHAAKIMGAYHKKKKTFDAMKISVTQPYSAVLTEDLGHRKATAYRDMDYWLDPERSIYRPQYTLEELRKSSCFSYFGGQLVRHIDEGLDGCQVYSSALHSPRGVSVLKGRRVIMAAGAIGTARILLRSLGLYDREIPFLAKPHWLVACLHPATLGQAGVKERLSLCQLVVSDEKTDSREESLSAGYAQLYSFKSLGLIRMLGFLPAPVPEAFGLLSVFVPSLVIADLRFPHHPSSHKTLKLMRSSGGEDRVIIRMQEEPGELSRNHDSRKRILKALKGLGLLPLKQKALPYGSTGHYAGTVPFSPSASSHALSVDTNGQLHQARHIYVADSSVFTFLPAKSICMTIMANANRIGERVRAVLEGGLDSQ